MNTRIQELEGLLRDLRPVACGAGYYSLAARIDATLSQQAEPVEPAPVNQCDGCQAGVPVDENGNHRMGKPGGYADLMRCEKARYVSEPAPAQDEREAFEECWAVRGADDEGNLGRKPLRSLVDQQRYRGDAVNGSWVWFQRGAAWQRNRPAQTEQQPEQSEQLDEFRKLLERAADALDYYYPGTRIEADINDALERYR